MKKYIKPDTEVVSLLSEQIFATSGVNGSHIGLSDADEELEPLSNTDLWSQELF